MKRLPRLCLLLIVPLILANCALFGKKEPSADLEPLASTGAPPKVVLPETTYDFGVIAEDKDYVHEFVVKNEGTGVLRIREVVPD